MGALPSKDGMRLLDVGCGRGGLLAFVLHQCPGVEAIGLERNPRRAAIAHRSTGTSVVRGDGGRLPFQSKTMDVVVLAKSLHHMSPETRARTLLESRRVLRRSGRLIVLERTAPRNVLERLGLHIEVGLGGEDRQVFHLFGPGLTGELEAASFEVLSDRAIRRTRLTLARRHTG